VFDNCNRHGIRFDGTANLDSNHVLAISGKENTKFDRNPTDVNVAIFVDILLVIGCLTVFCSIAKLVEDESWVDDGPTLKLLLTMADGVLREKNT